jgi:hypothetical protein
VKKEEKLSADVAKWKEEARQAVLKHVTLQARVDTVVADLQGQIHTITNKTRLTPMSLAEVVKLSPKSKNKVAKNSARGIWDCPRLLDARPTGKRDGFLANVVRCLKPIVVKICSIPKFRGGIPDPQGVIELISKSVRRKAKRKLFSGNGPASSTKRVKTNAAASDTMTTPAATTATFVTHKTTTCANP